MDLSFARLERGTVVRAIPVDLAVLLSEAAARQAASPTARVQAQLASGKPVARLLLPVDGAFHPAVAQLLQLPAGA